MLSFVLLGSFTILFSLSNTYPVAFVIYILIGFFVGNVKVLSKSLVYKYTHDHFIGRIMTTISMLSLALGIIVSLVIGYIGEKNINKRILYGGDILDYTCYINRSWCI